MASMSGDDLLYLERLDIFLEKSLCDLREFAQREGRDFEDVRMKAAEWHSRHLFRPTTHITTTSTLDPKTKVQEVLKTVSSLLESLLGAANQHSLLLVVDPMDNTDTSFLGGSITGREYWRGLRYGGEAGARNFKEHCRTSLGMGDMVQCQNCYESTGANSAGLKQQKQTPAVVLKNNLYQEMRSRLRAVSGVRNAEMKWSKPSKLSAYGVILEGWPSEIEYKNPSKMNLQEMSTLMQLLQNNTIHFKSLRDDGTLDSEALLRCSALHGDLDVSWACDIGDPVSDQV